MARVELVAPSPTAPCAFAAQTRRPCGERRAPTPLTHAGRPPGSADVRPRVCATTPAPHDAQQIKISASISPCALSNMIAPGLQWSTPSAAHAAARDRLVNLYLDDVEASLRVAP